ncbi:hypothetical protein ABZ800_12255 [Streptomyces sp. NPDC047813]|uniref:hypothetical protein n=1 Tax=Streptomyces sp. NPDC047813 TaxID=3154608 RepID=UPI0033EDF743
MPHPEHAPEPIRADPHLTDTEADAEARRIIADAYRPLPETPTAYRDTTPLPAYGSALPVAQPDRRIVPAWAAGTAVAGIGVGATCVGVGCGIWLACQGFAAVTLASVLFVTLPIAALAAVVTSIGSAVRSVKTTHAETHHHYTGPVYQDQRNVHTTTRGVWAKTTNEQC